MHLCRVHCTNTHLIGYLHVVATCTASKCNYGEDTHHKSSHQCPHPVNNSYCGTQFGGCSAWRSRFRLVQSDIPRRLMRWQNSVLKLGKQGSAGTAGVELGVSCVGEGVLVKIGVNPGVSKDVL